MRIKVQIAIESDSGEPVVHEVARITRDRLCSETLGLSVAESKEVLTNIQQRMAEQQAAD